LKGQVVIGLFICYAGSMEKGEEVVRPFREFGPPAVDLVEPMPYTKVQALSDPAFPPGRRNYWRSENMKELSDEAIDILVAYAPTISSPFSMLWLEPKGRAISRVRGGETAIGGRDAAHTLYAFSMWEDSAESDLHITWAHQIMEAMRPFTIPGVSPNFNSDQSENRVKAFFGAAKYERLAALKNKLDPTNLFHLNQNVKPTRRRRKKANV
jgi:hypothetical protein